MPNKATKASKSITEAFELLPSLKWPDLPPLVLIAQHFKSTFQHSSVSFDMAVKPKKRHGGTVQLDNCELIVNFGWDIEGDATDYEPEELFISVTKLYTSKPSVHLHSRDFDDVGQECAEPLRKSSYATLLSPEVINAVTKAIKKYEMEGW